jgi:hypothetical protein
MALPGRLKPIGRLAQTVDGLAKTKVIAPNVGAAQKALKATEPDFAAVVRNSNFEELVSRLFKVVDKNIVGQAALQSLVELEIALASAGLRVTKLDLSRCLEKMLQLQTARGGMNFSTLSAAIGAASRLKKSRQAYINAFSGELRERVVQHMLSVRILADVLVNEAKKRAKASGGKRVTVIDSAAVGDVRMPTTPASGRKPSPNALGPDRMFGFLVRDAKTTGGFAGTFHVTAIIEVKARTGALDGLQQFVKFDTRAPHGTITIDGKVYRIEIDDKKLQRILILPEDAIDRAKTIAEAKKDKINVLPYPAKIEDMITKQSTDAVDSMLNLKRRLN